MLLGVLFVVVVAVNVVFERFSLVRLVLFELIACCSALSYNTPFPADAPALFCSFDCRRRRLLVCFVVVVVVVVVIDPSHSAQRHGNNHVYLCEGRVWTVASLLRLGCCRCTRDGLAVVAVVVQSLADKTSTLFLVSNLLE